MKHLFSALIIVALVLGISSRAHSQGEITLLCPNPIMPRHTLETLRPDVPKLA